MFKFFAVLFTTVSLLGLNREDLHQPLTDTKLTLVGHSSVSQSFTSSYNNLNIVSICFRNPRRLLLPLRFELYERMNLAQPIRTIEFSGGNVSEGDCTRFQFEPISDSKNIDYLATIRAIDPEEVNPHTGIYAEGFGGEDYIIGQAYLDDVPTNIDLHFKTAYRENIWQTIRQSTNDFVMRLGQDYFFFIFYALIIFILLRKHQRSSDE